MYRFKSMDYNKGHIQNNSHDNIIFLHLQTLEEIYRLNSINNFQKITLTRNSNIIIIPKVHKILK